MIAIDRKMLERGVKAEEHERDQAAQRGEESLARFHDGRAAALQEVLDGQYAPMQGVPGGQAH